MTTNNSEELLKKITEMMDIVKKTEKVEKLEKLEKLEKINETVVEVPQDQEKKCCPLKKMLCDCKKNMVCPMRELISKNKLDTEKGMCVVYISPEFFSENKENKENKEIEENDEEEFMMNKSIKKHNSHCDFDANVSGLYLLIFIFFIFSISMISSIIKLFSAYS